MLYKHRWKIELFFKLIKQHLKIKNFWGTSENAACVQIWNAISVYPCCDCKKEVKHIAYFV